MEISVVEEEDDLEKKEVKSYAITVDSWAIMLEISRNLQRHVHIAKHMTIMWSNVPS